MRCKAKRGQGNLYPGPGTPPSLEEVKGGPEHRPEKGESSLHGEGLPRLPPSHMHATHRALSMQGQGERHDEGERGRREKKGKGRMSRKEGGER